MQGACMCADKPFIAGVSDFSRIIESGHYYVDKTRFLPI